MAANPLIAFRASPETKAALHALAQERNLSDSAFLQKLVELTLLQNAGVTQAQLIKPVEAVPRDARLYVRLRPEDHVLLRERATGRGIPAATYASMVLRAHLRAVTPLPDRELVELKRAVGELGMIGRNLNQIARLANQTGKLNGPSSADLRALLRALEGLRDHVKALMLANTASWESRHAEANLLTCDPIKSRSWTSPAMGGAALAIGRGGPGVRGYFGNHDPGAAAAGNLAIGAGCIPPLVDEPRRASAQWLRSVGASTSAERAAPTTSIRDLLILVSLFCLMRTQANERGLS